MSRTPRNVSESHIHVGGAYTEDRGLLRRCDVAARAGTCAVCEEKLWGPELAGGLHEQCGWTLDRDVELTIRSVVAMRRFELA
jgi:hypothetical protein